MISCYLALGAVALLSVEVVERPSHRFAVDKPTPTWIVQDTDGGSPAALQVSMGDPLAGGQVIVSVLATPFPDEGPDALRTISRERVSGRSGYSKLRDVDVRVGEEDVPGLAFRLARGDVVLEVVAAFVCVGDLGYVIQVGAPPDEFADHEDTFQRFRDSFRILELTPDQAERQRLEALAARCGSEIGWAASFADAAARAKQMRRLVVVYGRFYPGFQVGDPAMSAVFTDRDIVELIRSSFVAARLSKTDEPLRSHDVYGLSPTTFGTAVIVTDPDGTVLGETYAVTQSQVLRLLRRCLGDAAPPAVARGADLEEALASMRGGALADAMAALRRIAIGDESGSSEARYWLGECLLRTEGKDAAREAWTPLLEREDDPFAWRAADALTSLGFELGIPDRITDPPEDVARAAAAVSFDPRTPAELDEVLAGALRYLLDEQREEGSWICGAEIDSGAPTTDQDLTVAISAICARSLLPRRDVPAIRAAIDRAVGFLARARERAKQRDEPVVFMEYGTYADAYTIRLLADAADAGLIEADAAKDWIEELVARLAKKQRGNGGWSYYLSGDVTGSRVADHSIGFVTGAVTLAVLRAEELDVELPSGMIDRALDCLRRMKNDNGSYEYMMFTGAADAPRATARAGAAGRGTVMTLALLRGAKADLDELRESLEIYVEHQPHLAREAGKALMHCGLDGQGSHYVMFNYANTAQAIAALPVDERRQYRDALLESMLTKRTADGAFLDNPLIGRAYGAAMAIIAIDALRR